MKNYSRTSSWFSFLLRLPWAMTVWRMLSLALSSVKFYVTTDGQPASMSWNKAPIWGLWPDLYYFCDSYGLVLVGRPLWREDGSVFYMCCWPLPAQSFFGTRDHILLSQIWDFPFRRLLRLAGSRWRYSILPPHEDPHVILFITSGEPNRDHHFEQLWFCPLSQRRAYWTIGYQWTHSLLFIAAGTWFLKRCSAMDVRSGSTIPAFRRHVTIFIWSDTCLRHFWLSHLWLNKNIVSGAPPHGDRD
jgi:hypothetical protein